MRAYATLYIADDHQIIIDGLKLLIGNEEDIKIVGYANDGTSAFADIIERKPDLVLTDFRMPGMDGLELIYRLRKLVPETKFIILSMHHERRYVQDAINGGASGYLQKNTGKEEVKKCLRKVLAGDTYFPDSNIGNRDTDKLLFTPREVEILKLVLEECTSAEIASKLSLSRLTVDTHRKNIGRKTNTNTLVGLINFLRENKIEL